MKKLKLKVSVADINAWEDMDDKSQQATECFRACVELMLLGCGNKVSVYSDQSPDAVDVMQYDKSSMDFDIHIVDGGSEDYESVRDGLEITLNDTIGIEYCVKFSVADIGNHNYQVQMTQTEDTVLV